MAYKLTLWEFFFKHSEWEDAISRCNNKTIDEWRMEVNSSSVFVGTIYVVIGIIFMVMYIPILMAISKKEFMQYSCYKIMFYIGMVDVMILPTVAIWPGIRSLLGIHFCVCPKVNFLVNSTNATLYYAFIPLMMALALNRICEITWRTGADMFFRRNRVHFWILLSILNGIVAALFTPLSDYSTRYLTYAHDYFAGTQGLGGSDVFSGSGNYNIVTDITSSVFLVVAYVSLSVYLFVKVRVLKIAGQTTLQYIMTINSAAICLESLAATLFFYITFTFFNPPDEVVILGQLIWIMEHGNTPIMIYLLNPSIRSEIHKKIRNKLKPNLVITVATTSLQPQRVALAPIICLMCPYVFMMIAVAFSIPDVINTTTALFLISSLHSTLNTLMMVLTIRSYRDTVIRTLTCGRFQKNSVVNIPGPAKNH